MAQTVRCDCCEVRRLPEELTALDAWRRTYFSSYKDVLDFVQNSTEPCICDECFQNGEALKARPLHQNKGGSYSVPFFAYWDQTEQCSTCKTYFVFDKHEQKFWYEELKFPIYSQAKDCPDCRKTNRDSNAEETALGRLIRNLDESDANQLEAIIRIFARRRNAVKAKYYLSFLPKIEGFSSNEILKKKHLELKACID